MRVTALQARRIRSRESSRSSSRRSFSDTISPYVSATTQPTKFGMWSGSHFVQRAVSGERSSQHSAGYSDGENRRPVCVGSSTSAGSRHVLLGRERRTFDADFAGQRATAALQSLSAHPPEALDVFFHGRDDLDSGVQILDPIDRNLVNP
jgi:hypothetical protein